MGGCRDKRQKAGKRCCCRKAAGIKGRKQENAAARIVGSCPDKRQKAGGAPAKYRRTKGMDIRHDKIV